MVHVIALVQRIRIRPLWRLPVIQTQHRQPRLARPAHELVIVIPWVHSHESTTGDVQHNLIVLLQRTDRPIEVQPSHNRLLVAALLRPGYSDLTRRIPHQPRPHEVCQGRQIRRRPLVPCHTQMVHRQRGPDLPDLLVRLLRADQVVHAEHYR